MIIYFLTAIGMILAGGLLSLLSKHHPRMACAWSMGGTVAGCVLASFAALKMLWIGGIPESLRLGWDVPYGAFFIEIDPLSAFFLLPILGLSALAAIYGYEYLRPYRQTKNLGMPGFCFCVLVASMMMVVVARNAVLFLVCWEIMSLASFFLVTLENDKKNVRDAGWTYLVATHLGTAFLLVMFLILGKQSGSLDFDSFGRGGAMTSSTAGVLFILAIVGFGTKAGFVPFHVWLPEAHPAAPSHVSALMSGVMIKTGIYGLVRTLMFLGMPPIWWGWFLIGVGLTSGICGIVFALFQRDLKRFLAYSSVENIGIITMGLGVGVLGLGLRSPFLAVFGFAGGLLHVINHALFKGLLFLGAGSVLHATGTGEIDRLGGLSKKMPATSLTFLIAAVAICGLPPLNGFVSEFLIFLGAYKGATSLVTSAVVPLVAVIVGLALIGGLAAAGFTKIFGAVFLGEPRTQDGSDAHDPGPAMRVPLIILALGCIGIGLFSPFVLRILTTVLQEVTGMPVMIMRTSLSDATMILFWVAGTFCAFLALVLVLMLVRHKLLSRRQIKEGITWDCGYAAPSARMQYTASSFSQPLVDLFRPLVRTRRKFVEPAGFFPNKASLEIETADLCRNKIYRPIFRFVEWGSQQMRWLQEGHVQIYVLYIAVTLLLLLLWNLG